VCSSDLDVVHVGIFLKTATDGRGYKIFSR
jgi:hypothetical protein